MHISKHVIIYISGLILCSSVLLQYGWQFRARGTLGERLRSRPLPGIGGLGGRPVGVLRQGVCEVAAPVASVVCEGGVVVRTWLSLHTECFACCSCVESWEKVYWRILACVTAPPWPPSPHRLHQLVSYPVELTHAGSHYPTGAWSLQRYRWLAFLHASQRYGTFLKPWGLSPGNRDAASFLWPAQQVESVTTGGKGGT